MLYEVITILPHGVDRSILDADNRFVEPFAGTAQEVVDQIIQRLDPVAKRRHGDGEDIEAIEQVFTEPSLPDAVLQVFRITSYNVCYTKLLR